MMAERSVHKLSRAGGVRLASNLQVTQFMLVCVCACVLSFRCCAVQFGGGRRLGSPRPRWCARAPVCLVGVCVRPAPSNTPRPPEFDVFLSRVSARGENP